VPDAPEGPYLTAWGTDPDAPHGPRLDEPLRWAAELEAMGVELINATLGNPYASPHILRPFEYSPPDGYETPEHPLLGVARHLGIAAEAQRACRTAAVVGSGYSWLQAFALHAGAAAVRLGHVRLVGLGRASLAQPDFGARLMAGEPLDPKRVCRTFSYCTALMRNKAHPLGQFPTGCPPFDKEGYSAIWKEAQASADSDH
jgi:2,4-dienoyl-CoA reductase-like NADH-dependent reductase (Old Yellow Enzyme family)